MSAVNTLTTMVQACLAVLILAAVASLGMTVVARLVTSHRPAWLIGGAVVSQAAAVPVMALILVRGIAINPGGLTGLTLVALCGAGSAGLRVARRSRPEDRPAAVSTVVVVQLADVVAVPVAASWIAGGPAPAEWAVGRNLLLLVVLPLLIGVVLAVRHREPSMRWDTPPDRVAAVAVAIALVGGIATNWDVVTGAPGSWLLSASLFIAIAVGVVVALVGVGPAGSGPVGLLPGIRLLALMLIIIGASGADGAVDYLAPATVISLADLTAMLLVAHEIRRRIRPPPSSDPDDDARVAVESVWGKPTDHPEAT